MPEFATIVRSAAADGVNVPPVAAVNVGDFTLRKLVDFIGVAVKLPPGVPALDSNTCTLEPPTTAVSSMPVMSIGFGATILKTCGDDTAEGLCVV